MPLSTQAPPPKLTQCVKKQTSSHVGESQQFHMDVAHPVCPCLPLPVSLDVEVMQPVTVQLCGHNTIQHYCVSLMGILISKSLSATQWMSVFTAGIPHLLKHAWHEYHASTITTITNIHQSKFCIPMFNSGVSSSSLQFERQYFHSPSTIQHRAVPRCPLQHGDVEP